MNEAVGVLHSIGDTQQVSEKFRKREFVIKEDGGKEEYPNYLAFELVQDDVTKVDSLSVGDKVKVSYYTNGRLWTPTDGRPERCFVTLKPSSVEVLEVSRSATKGMAPVAPAAAPAAAPADDDSLPF